MPHNQTIDGMPRERIQEIISDIERGGRLTAVEKLRALLDAPAAQPQGEPIKRYNTTVSHGGSYEHVVLEEHKNGHVIKAVDFDAYVTRNYAEQPEPVAAVTYQQVFKAYEYAEAHPHKYLRGTTNWCAAVAYALNAQKPLTAVKGDPGA